MPDFKIEIEKVRSKPNLFKFITAVSDLITAGM
jgi:hypothetical protein